MLTYHLDPQSKTPLYEQLYRAIRTDIMSGALAGGERLPSKRQLSANLRVSQITVETAYAQLLAEGYIISEPRRGYRSGSWRCLRRRSSLPEHIPQLGAGCRPRGRLPV